jgi:hypothetical protein
MFLYKTYPIVFVLLVFYVNLKAQINNTENILKRLVNFEWEPIKDAKTYEIELESMSASLKLEKRVFIFVSSKPVFNGKLIPGRYKIRLRSRDIRNVPGEWSNQQNLLVPLEYPVKLSPINGFKIETDQDEKAVVNLNWQSVPGAKSYRVSIYDQDRKKINEELVFESKMQIEVPVAKYFYWNTQAFSADQDPGDNLENLAHFSVIGKKLNRILILKPENAYVRELNWEKNEFAESYKINLWHKSEVNRWEQLIIDKDVGETKLSFPPSFRGGTYLLKVVGKATLRLDSEPNELEFVVIEGDRSEEAEDRMLLMQSINRSDGWYFIASYLITEISYFSTNYDSFISPTYKTLGGTGRLGAGYLGKNTPWGFLLIADMSGFVLNNKNHSYFSSEMHFINRDRHFSHGEVRFSTGFFIKSLPIIELNLNDSSGSQFKQLIAVGPHLGVEYLHAISQRIGFQLNGRVYSSLIGKTPNGLPMDPALSFQYGLFGSYRFSVKKTGLIGITIKRDAIQYKTINEHIVGQEKVNEAKIEGSYLNLIFEKVF